MKKTNRMTEFLKRNRYSILLGLSIFFFIIIFFIQVHPIYPYDADDWTYLYRWRDAYPSIYQYNPTRLLPEILTPICGELAMVLVYPIVGDITISVCILTSFVLATIITCYILLFFRMLQKTFLLKPSDCLLLSLLFFAFHFFLFAKYNGENQHLFYSFDLCCHYNYTIPNILASCYVLLFITNKYEYYSLKNQYLKQGVFLLGIYLVIFSHLFESIILIAYLGVLLLFELPAVLKKKEKIGELLLRYRLHISIIFIWLIALCFEANGRRAQDVEDISRQPFVEAIIDSSKKLIAVLVQQSNPFANVLLLIIFIVFGILFYKRRKEGNSFYQLFIVTIITAFVCCFYVILMAAKSYPYYILRLMTIYSVPFFILLAGFTCLAGIIHRKRWIISTIPYLLLLICCKMEHRGDTFQDVQTLLIKQNVQGIYKVTPDEILIQNNTIINTIIDADRRGEKEVSINVPKYDHVDNWPLAFYYGKRLGEFLYKYGIIDNRITVNVLPQNYYNSPNTNGRAN